MADDLSPAKPGGLNTALLTRFIVFFLVAGTIFLIFMWIVFVRGSYGDVSLAAKVELYEDGKLIAQELGIGEHTVGEDALEVYFDEVDLMKLDPGSTFVVSEVIEEDGFWTVDLKLESGAIWVSNMGGVLDLMLKTDSFMFQNVDGYYYVQVEGVTDFAYAYKHPLRVHFLDSSGNSLNTYLLPEGYYGEYLASGASSVVADLRYAKLTKEYPFYFLSEEDKDQWDGDVKIDNSRYIEILSGFKSFVRKNYDAGYDTGAIGGAIDFLQQFLTFSDNKKDQLAADDTVSNLNAALYLSVKGEEEDALQKLVAIEEGIIVGDKYSTYLNYLNVVLNNSVYGGELYPVKDHLRNLLYGGTDEGEIVVLKERLNEMYDLVGGGDVALAKEAFDVYERGWWDFLGMTSSDLAEFRKDISEERELLSVLLLQESGFYDADYFELLEEFESAVFKIAAVGSDLDEERQSFVSSKIQVLNNIEELLRVNGITVEDATDVMLLLLESADELMDSIESEAAVLSYFEEQLEEAWLVLYFINSTEYTGLTGSFDERFDAYLQKEQDIADLKDYLQGLHLGADAEADMTLDEAKDIVERSLDIAGVGYSVVVSFGDTGYRLFEVMDASIGDTDFEAKYDRENELVYDLVIEGEELATGVRLDDLTEVIEGVVSVDESSDETPPLDTAEEEEITEEELTYAEQLAISLVIDYLDGYDIKIEDDQVVSWDLDQNLFFIRGYTLLDVDVDFFVHAADDLITDLVVDGVDYDGVIGVDELEEAVQQALDEAQEVAEEE